MLTGGFAPCLPPWPIVKVKLQGKYEGYDTDDLIVFAREPSGGREAKLLVQVKHAVSITPSDAILSDVMRAAWNDYINPQVFTHGLDSLALATGPLTRTDLEVRTILEWARSCEDATEFVRKVELPKFSSETKT